MHLLQAFWWWFEVHTGTYIPPGEYSVYYNFWSGFGSDIGEVTIIVALISYYRSTRCHIDKCHRRGKYPFQHYKLCHIHHPKVDGELTHKHIKELHEQAK